MVALERKRGRSRFLAAAIAPAVALAALLPSTSAYAATLIFPGVDVPTTVAISADGQGTAPVTVRRTSGSSSAVSFPTEAVFTAGEGYTFPAQSTVASQYSADNVTFTATQMQLVGCTVSNAGKTLSCTITTGGATMAWPPNTSRRWLPVVQLDAGLTPGTDLGTGQLTFSFVDDATDTLTVDQGTVNVAVMSIPEISSPAEGARLTTGTPTFSGTGRDGATIEVRDANSTVLCSAVVTSGTWSCAASPAIPDGTVTVTPVALDGFGGSTPGPAISLTIDTTAPAPPVISSPADGATLTLVRPVFSGTGEDNATVTIRDQDGVPICSATVPAGGAWTCTSTADLPDATYTFTATQVDAAGFESSASAPVTVTIDMTPPAPAGGTVCAQNADGTVTCTGTATPGTTVEVSSADGDVICTVVVPPDGQWSCTTTGNPGPSNVSVVVIDPNGNRSTPVTVSVTPYSGGGTPPSAPPVSDGLARTGGAALGYAAGGATALLLLIVGATLLLVRKQEPAA